jgi:endoglucanase
MISTIQNSTIVVRVSGDYYLGAPQFQLMVDGKPVGAVKTVTADHSTGQWQDFTFTGNFGTDGVNKVEVVYLNDRYGGSSSKDRNLYVDKITVDGQVYQSETHADYLLSNGRLDPGREKLALAGRLIFDLDDSAPVQTGGSAPAKPAPSGSTSTTTGDDTIVVRVSGDQYEGAPQFQLLVDGKAVGDVKTVTAVHDANQWQDFTFKGEFDSAQKVEVAYLNDRYGGSGSKDRNLYVDKITVDGKVYEAEASSLGHEKMPIAEKMAFALGSGGSTSGTPGTPAPTGDDTIVVRVSGDQYQGAPQFQLMVDGQAVGGPQTVTAVHGNGQWQNVTFKGDFDDADKIEVVYLNDVSAGTGKDRNLYVDKITVDGTVYEAETKGVYDRVSGSDITGAQKMNVAGKMVFDMSDSDPTPAPTPNPSPSTGGSGSNGPSATGHFSIGDDGKMYDPQGHEFEVRGANLFPNQYDKSYVNAVDAWDFNALRINCAPGKYTYDQLDKTIDAYTSRGIVTILTWQEVGSYGDGPGERKAILDFFSRVAEEYKDNPYVWYGGYNEPGGGGDVAQVNGQWQWDPTDVNRWVDLSRDIIHTVRDAGAIAPVLAPSMALAQDILMTSNWNRDVGFSKPIEEASAILMYGDRITSGFENVAFDVHLYGNYNTKDRLKNLDLFLDKAEERGIAIVFGEYGSGVYNNAKTTDTIQSSENMAALRDQHSFGDIVWHASASNPNDVAIKPGTDGGIRDVDSFTNPTNLTELGHIAWEGTH